MHALSVRVSPIDSNCARIDELIFLLPSGAEDSRPLEIGCFEGDKAETLTIVSIVEQFAERHGIADMVVVADAGMLSAKNLTALEEANPRGIPAVSWAMSPPVRRYP